MTRGLASKTIAMLDYAMTCIKSVDYRVSLRWLFYRLIQGFGLTKKDYNPFKRAVANARKNRLRGWHPGILADETRQIYDPNKGYSTLDEWIRAVKTGIKCNLDKHIGQLYNIQVWFEAKAMFEQFRKYTEPYYVPLAPFGGDASIPFKQEIADSITKVTNNGRLVVVLYFGDWDDKGKQIPKSALRDICKWTLVEFEFIRVGLNPDQVQLYDIPENPLRPREYQWEALEDKAASKLITNALDRFIDLEGIEKVKKLEERAEAYLASHLKKWDPMTLLKESSSKTSIIPLR